MRFAPERGQLYRLTTKEQQQTEAKVDSCYPVALEKGHPTFRLRAMHRTAPSVQIFNQTTNYYRSTDNTVLSGGENPVEQLAVVGIAWVTQIFPVFRGKSAKSALEQANEVLREFQNEISGPKFVNVRYESRSGTEYLWKSLLGTAMTFNAWRSGRND